MCSTQSEREKSTYRFLGSGWLLLQKRGQLWGDQKDGGVTPPTALKWMNLHVKNTHQPGFALGEALSMSTLGPSSGLPAWFEYMCHKANSTKKKKPNKNNQLTFRFCVKYHFSLPVCWHFQLPPMQRRRDSSWPCSDRRTVGSLHNHTVKSLTSNKQTGDYKDTKLHL